MFGIGSTELVIILIVALVLIGPSKLPDLMKSVGKGIAEFRRMSTDVRSTIEREIERADEAKRVEETKKELFGDGAESKTAEAPAAASGPASPETAQAFSGAAVTHAAPPAGDAPKAGDAAAVTETAHVASSEVTGPAGAEKPAATAKPQDKTNA